MYICGDQSELGYILISTLCCDQPWYEVTGNHFVWLFWNILFNDLPVKFHIHILLLTTTVFSFDNFMKVYADWDTSAGNWTNYFINIKHYILPIPYSVYYVMNIIHHRCGKIVICFCFCRTLAKCLVAEKDILTLLDRLIYATVPSLAIQHIETLTVCTFNNIIMK